MYSDTESDTTERQDNLVVPFDIALAPENLLSDDAPSQEQVFQAAIFNADLDQDEEDNFDNQPKCRRKLDYYKNMYNRQECIHAISSLDCRAEITFRNSPFVTPPSSPDMAWMPQDHFLDLMVCVGDGLGLGALLPNLQVHHNYEMTFDLSQPFRTFSAKFAMLGFDPTGSMHFIGRSPASEDVWVAWMPRVQSHDDESHVGECKGTTAMSTHHFRLSYMFLVTMLQQIGARDVLVLSQYPNVDDNEEFTSATRIP
jgi:hypothetical protein